MSERRYHRRVASYPLVDHCVWEVHLGTYFINQLFYYIYTIVSDHTVIS